MRIKFSNNAVGSLTETVTASASYVTIKVNAELIPLLPTIVTSEDFFVVTLEDSDAAVKEETVQVTNVSSTDLTVIRDWDGTGLGVFDSTTSSIGIRLTAKALNDIVVKMQDDAPLTDGSRVIVDSQGLLVNSPAQFSRVHQEYTVSGAGVTGSGQVDFTVTGSGAADSFTNYPGTEDVYLSYIKMPSSEYTISGNVVTLTSGVYTGTKVSISYIKII
tara:strand:+ start:4020 stop:4673 length:654 start_codon:yes stop_codon:yes gene_type:complete